MKDENTPVEEIVEKLSQERDELRVKLELAKLEIREKWEPLENKWESLEARLRSVGGTTTDAGKDVLAASKLLLGEIGDAYKQIWDEIKKQA